jgi:hypothetical protein
MSETKVKRGPKKSAADKLAELIASKRKDVERAAQRYAAAKAAERVALTDHGTACNELKQLEAAHKALVGAGDV